MPAAQLHITLIQPNIIWEDIPANLQQYTNIIAGITEKKEVIVLPEMFSTGFSMRPKELAESMDGSAVTWMKDMARQHRCIIAGSLMISEDGKYYNRFLWVQPDGKTYHYDKRHRFAYAGEDAEYTAGEKRVIVQVKGIRICLLVCYDLRFPVWARNQGDEYDVLLYVANWPVRRQLAWETLLQARAIENLSYCVGVNRVGEDGNGITYKGGSSVFSPLGEKLWQGYEAGAYTVTIDKETVTQARTQFPFLNDADRFMIL